VGKLTRPVGELDDKLPCHLAHTPLARPGRPNALGHALSHAGERGTRRTLEEAGTRMRIVPHGLGGRQCRKARRPGLFGRPGSEMARFEWARRGRAWPASRRDRASQRRSPSPPPACFGNLGYRRRVTEPTDPAPAAPDIGRLIGERYRLAEIIGVGGMATVHRALDMKLDRPVAIKLLRREVIADPDIAMRFRREALASTVLRHPNIVACLETGTDDGQPYLVMELIEGEDLAARLRRVGRMEPADTARIGLDIARALGVAHIRGIVHRDVKPANIVLARDGRSMITDFGIARLAADTEGAVPGTTLGSVHYFSPEQAKGETTTAASDVYSLGLVLFETLTGQRAWSGDTTATLAAARIGSVAPSSSALRPDVPAALDAVIARALDPDPARRYPNGNVMATALEPLVAYPDPASPTVGTDTAVLAPPLRPMAAASMSPPAGRASARRAPRAIAASLGVLLIVVAVVAGALVVAALPGRTGLAVASATPPPSAGPTRTPTATLRPTQTAAPTPTRAPKPTVAPKSTPKPPSTGAADLCEPFFGFACGLDKGTYQPSAFVPPIRFVLGDGWSTATSEPNLVTLTRGEGGLTIASGISSVYPSGSASKAPTSARGLVETLIVTDGVAAGKPTERRVDKRKAIVVELATTGPGRIALFGSGDQLFYLKPSGTTRFIVIDGKTGPVVIAIEPGADSTLESIAPAAEAVVKSLRFR